MENKKQELPGVQMFTWEEWHSRSCNPFSIHEQDIEKPITKMHVLTLEQLKEFAWSWSAFSREAFNREWEEDYGK